MGGRRVDTLAVIAACLCALNAHAQDKPSVEAITRQVVQAVDHYTAAIACQRGGVAAKDIAVVQVRPGSPEFHVVPALSSPQVSYPLPPAFEDRVIGSTSDSLVMEGLFWGPDDALCCASHRIRYALKQATDGNWAITSQRELAPRPAR